MEKLTLRFLDSVSMYFCEITGLFYSELYEGEQAYSTPQFSIDDFIPKRDARLNINMFLRGLENTLGDISALDLNVIYQCFLRKTKHD